MSDSRAGRLLGTALLVAAGGALGASARVALAEVGCLLAWSPWWSTAVANVCGGLAIGWLFVQLELRFQRMHPSRLAPTPHAQRLAARGWRLGPDPTLPPVELFRSDRRVRLYSAFGITGFLGGFTTFSTWALEMSALLRAGDRGEIAAAFAIATILPLAATFLGLKLGEWHLGTHPEA